MAEFVQTPYTFKYETARLTADRGGELNLIDAILELNIYESISSNYLTGEIIIADTVNINEIVNWQGTEKLEIRINNGVDEENEFHKNFVVIQINESRKGTDASAVYVLQLVEDIYFKSAIELSNKSYVGQPHEMISQILSDSKLEKTLDVLSNPVQSRFRYITPNIPPLEAVENISLVCTDEDGLPYYCYSELGSDKLVLKSLGEILEDRPHGKIGFTFRQQKIGKQDAISLNISSRIIEDYNHYNSVNILRQSENGAIGSDWTFLNLNQFSTNDKHHSIVEKIPLLQKHLPRNQQTVLYDELAFDGMHNKKSARIVYPYLSNLYSDYEFNINDVDDQDGYNRRSTSHAFRSLLSKDPIDVKIPGYHFWPKDQKGKSIGHVIPLVFYNNYVDADVDNSGPETTIDKKMSGEHIITHCRHHFNRNRYDVYLTCTKFSSGSNVDPETVGP